MLQLVQHVPGTKGAINNLQASSNLYLSPIVYCLIFLWISSLVYLSQKVTPLLLLLTIFPKAAHVIPLPKLPTVFVSNFLPMISESMASFLIFLFYIWKAFCNALRAEVSLTSGYHPQPKGESERCNQEFESALRCVINNNPASFSKYLPWVEYFHNCHTSSATGFSPFEAPLGYNPPLFPSLESKILIPSVQIHLRRCCRFWRQTREALLRTAQQNKRFADRHRSSAPTYHVGQKVWLSTCDIPIKNTPRKLALMFIGNFPVERIIHPSGLRLHLPTSMRIHPTFHL